MKKLNKFLILALICAFSVLTSCNSKEKEPQPTVFSAFATLTSVTDNSISFSVQESEDSAPVVLTASVAINPQNFKVGNRYVIQYSTPDNNGYTPGSMTLYVILGAYNGSVATATMDEIRQLTQTPLNVNYAGRTGSYINLMVDAALTEEPKDFGLYVDETTLDSEWPEVYIGFNSNTSGTLEYVNFYGSFDVSSLLNLPGAKGIKLQCRSKGFLVFKNGREGLMPAE